MINIAQIGVGYWGPNLLRNLVANRNCRVKTGVDLSKERRNYVKSLYPAIQVTDDVNQVFQDPEIKGVVIATPVATHYGLAMQALESGKHILVEKPMAEVSKRLRILDGLRQQKIWLQWWVIRFFLMPPSAM